jgi:hypothetical protein
MTENSAGQNRTALVASVFLVFSVLLYLPGTIFFSNLNEFSLLVEDLLKIFLPTALFAIACSMAVVVLLPIASRIRLISVVFAFGALFWIQGNLLVWTYGTLDGSDLQLETHWRNGLIDTPIWVLIILIALWLPKKFVKTISPIAIVIMAIQTISLVVAAGVTQTKSEGSTARAYSIDETGKYEFSSDRNVILIVLDAFQSDVFLEIISEEPKYAETFQGFTYFRNAVAASSFTELAIPALLTGKVYDNSRPRAEYLREAYLEYGITAELKREGFWVDIYPWVGWGNESIYFDEAIASNVTKVDRRETAEATFTEKKAKEALYLADLSAFRVVPHFLKAFIYNDQSWRVTDVVSSLMPERAKHAVSNNDEYSIGYLVDRAPKDLSIDRTMPVFKYFHLSGAHSPLTVGEDLTFSGIPIPFSRRNYVLQAKANLLYLGQLFEKLKRAGIFDDSMILVVGDHGSAGNSEMLIDPPTTAGAPQQLQGTDRNFQLDKARAIPLMLVKQGGSTGRLETSNAPVATVDIPATIRDELGIDSSARESSVFRVETKSSRDRYFAAFEYLKQRSAYVDDITLYRISGDSWKDESWSFVEVRSAGLPAKTD